MPLPPVVDTLPPPHSLLDACQHAGEHCDAHALDLPHRVDLPAWVQAFYTGRLFRLERVVLALLGRPSRDAQALALAQGQGGAFAAWTVTTRRPDELLLTEFTGATRSWLAVQAQPDGSTRLWFGSALVPRAGRPAPSGRVFQALVQAHLAYSRALMRSAVRQWARRAGSPA